MLATAPLEIGVVVAIAAAFLSALVSPLNSHTMSVAWLLSATALLGLLGVQSLKQLRSHALSELDVRGSG